VTGAGTDRDATKGQAMIYHLVGAAEWDAGEYRPGSLDVEGFVHLSTGGQLLGTANRFYPGRTDLLVLVVDPAALPDLRWEPPAPGPDGAPYGGAPYGGAPYGGAPHGGAPDLLFPHSYTPLPAVAVVGAHPFPPGPDGRFTVLPAALAESGHWPSRPGG
jgi:uncharacterized protein (DUF952 family)